MKTLLIAALLSTSLLSAQAHGNIFENQLNIKKTEKKRSEAEELKQKVDVQLYNLDMLKSQYQKAQEAIKNSKGNHQEIDKDFEYFNNLLEEDAKAGKNAEEIEKSIQHLKKEYTRKHKNRASYELKEHKALAATMQKELNNYTREYKSLKAKYKKYIEANGSATLQQLENELEETAKLLKESTDASTRSVAYYDRQLQDTKKA